METHKIFLSYSRINAEFALNLAVKLKEAGVSLWIDQLDIPPGARWDVEVGNALERAECLLVVLSKTSVSSNNVLDEVSYALDSNKKVVPVLIDDCVLPFRLRRLQYVDFSKNFDAAFNKLLKALNEQRTHEQKNLFEAAGKVSADKSSSRQEIRNTPENKSQFTQRESVPNKTTEHKKKSGISKGMIVSTVVIVALLAVIFKLTLFNQNGNGFSKRNTTDTSYKYALNRDSNIATNPNDVNTGDGKNTGHDNGTAQSGNLSNKPDATGGINNEIDSKNSDEADYLTAKKLNNQTYPIKIRGGENIQITTRKGNTGVLMYINFIFADHSAVDGLQPGEGSWLDRGRREGEPAQIRYLVNEANATSIESSLSSPDNYYVFECFNTNSGYLLAIQAKASPQPHE